jgi:hypothetical protein
MAAIAIVSMFAVMVLAMPARAADVVFPAGSRIGLVPPPGMVPSRTFQGFEDIQNKAAMLITSLPAAAYNDLEKSAVPDDLKKQGIDSDQRETMQLSTGNAFLIRGKQVVGNAQFRKWLLVASATDLTVLVSVQVPEQDSTYPDKVVRDSLATLAVRATVSDAERLSVLPFTVGDMAGFHIDDVLPGRALMLVDTSTDHGTETTADNLKARLFIAAMQGGPSESDDRGNFARVNFDQVVGIKDVQIQMSEPLRIGNQPGYQTVAKAKDARSDADLMVAEWLRFGTGGFLEMIGIARAELWPDTFTRLRAVRDSIDLK